MTAEEYIKSRESIISRYQYALTLAIQEIEDLEANHIFDSQDILSARFALTMYKQALQKHDESLQRIAEKDMLQLTGRAYISVQFDTLPKLSDFMP